MLRVVSIAAVICLPATPTLARQVAAPTTESNATFFATQQVIPQDNPNPESSKFSPIVVEKDWAWGSNALSGDWCGARTRLSNAGVVLSATSTTDLATVIGGGNQQGFIMPYLIDVNLSLDTEKFGAWQGGEFFADFQQAGATQLGSRYVPDYWGWDVIYTLQTKLHRAVAILVSTIALRRRVAFEVRQDRCQHRLRRKLQGSTFHQHRRVLAWRSCLGYSHLSKSGWWRRNFNQADGMVRGQVWVLRWQYKCLQRLQQISRFIHRQQRHRKFFVGQPQQLFLDQRIRSALESQST